MRDEVDELIPSAIGRAKTEPRLPLVVHVNGRPFGRPDELDVDAEATQLLAEVLGVAPFADDPLGQVVALHRVDGGDRDVVAQVPDAGRVTHSPSLAPAARGRRGPRPQPRCVGFPALDWGMNARWRCRRLVAARLRAVAARRAFEGHSTGSEVPTPLGSDQGESRASRRHILPAVGRRGVAGRDLPSRRA